MPRVNVYITTYNYEIIEEVEKTLSRLGLVIEKKRSSVVPQFFYYRIEVSNREDLEKALREYYEKDLIAWYKIEPTLG